jgi:reverse gyrase
MDDDRLDEGLTAADFRRLMDTSKSLTERMSSSLKIFNDFSDGGVQIFNSIKPDHEKLSWISSRLLEHGIAVENYTPENWKAYEDLCEERSRKLNRGLETKN